VPPAHDTPTKAEVMKDMDRLIEDIGEAIGGYTGRGYTGRPITNGEKTHLDGVKKSIGDELDAHPDELSNPDQLVAKELKDIHDVLNPEHQKKFDDMMAGQPRRMQGMVTSVHLHQIGQALILYGNDFPGASPADLGELVTTEDLTPKTVLAGGSTTTPPDDYVKADKTQAQLKLDAKTEADWVNGHADFIYLGAGRKSNIDANFIVAYVKPEASKELYVLHGDGSVVQISPDTVDKTLAQLKAGTNPPPSAKAVDIGPPPGAPRP